MAQSAKRAARRGSRWVDDEAAPGCPALTTRFAPRRSPECSGSSRFDTSAAQFVFRYHDGMIDSFIVGFDRALRTLSGNVQPTRIAPGLNLPEPELSPDQRRQAAGLMRVNHTGEVCAQALYAAQALVARDPVIKQRFAAAARDEEDHLAWTQQRLAALGDRTSLLNPLWYAGAFAIGVAAGFAGDRTNLGFVVETERQVEEHLTGHIDRLPAGDTKSLAIVEQMRDDEVRHGAMALEAGAAPIPSPVKYLMRRAADVMRAIAYRI